MELFRHMSAEARGRIARAWTRNKDHLQADYHSVLEFLLFMEDFLVSTVGHGVVEVYSDPGRYLAVTTLAGASNLQVHPWALYFVAAAQVGMDVTAHRGEGQGHYIAPAAMYVELRSIHGDIESFLQAARAGGGRGAQAFHASIRARLAQVIEVVHAQQGPQATGPGYHPGETQREPTLVEWVSEPGRFSALVTNMAEAGTNADALARLVGIRDALSSGLGQLPQRVGEHGWAALDPHGTLHGVGLAMDLFNSTNRLSGEHGTNFSILREAWPFIQFMAREHGSEYGLTGGEAVNAFEPNTREAAQRRYNLSGMVQRYWPALRRQLEGGLAPSGGPAEEPEILGDYDNALDELGQDLQRRISALFQGAQRKFDNHHDLRTAIDEAVVAMRTLRDQYHQLRPENLVQDIDHVITLLNRVVEIANRTPRLSEEGQRAVSTADAINEDPHQDLTRLRDAIRQDLPELGPAFGGRETRLLSAEYARNQRAIRDWFDIVSTREERIFDQPPELVEGLLSTESTSFSGGHHWQIEAGERTPGQESTAMPTESGYQSALLRDMNRRSPDALRRILVTMAENPSGRISLLGGGGEGGGRSRDEILETALRTWANGPARPTYDELIAQVQSSIETYTGTGASLLQSLQARGFHQLADDLAGEFGAGVTEAGR
jgi:hypothetical protein